MFLNECIHPKERLRKEGVQERKGKERKRKEEQGKEGKLRPKGPSTIYAEVLPLLKGGAAAAQPLHGGVGWGGGSTLLSHMAGLPPPGRGPGWLDT